MDWLDMSQVLTERNSRTENCNNNYPCGHATEIECTYDVQGTSRLLRTSSERLMYPQFKLGWDKKSLFKNLFHQKIVTNLSNDLHVFQLTDFHTSHHLKVFPNTSHHLKVFPNRL